MKTTTLSQACAQLLHQARQCPLLKQHSSRGIFNLSSPATINYTQFPGRSSRGGRGAERVPPPDQRLRGRGEGDAPGPGAGLVAAPRPRARDLAAAADLQQRGQLQLQLTLALLDTKRRLSEGYRRFYNHGEGPY